VNATFSVQSTLKTPRSAWVIVAPLSQSSRAMTTSLALVLVPMFTFTAVSLLEFTKLDPPWLPHWTWVFAPFTEPVIWQSFVLPALSQLERLVNVPLLLPRMVTAKAGEAAASKHTAAPAATSLHVVRRAALLA